MGGPGSGRRKGNVRKKVSGDTPFMKEMKRKNAAYKKKYQIAKKKDEEKFKKSIYNKP